MGLFSKVFGSKVTADKSTAKLQDGDFITALSMQLRDELDPALAAYLDIAEEFPNDALAPFFAAAIKAGKGNTTETADTLRLLSSKAAQDGESLSLAITQRLFAQLNNGPTPVSVPAVAEVLVAFGVLLKKEGFVQESAVCFEIAAGLAPDNAHVLHKLGDTLHDLRIYDYAESVLLDALKCAPNHWDALYTYAVLLQDLGRNEEAIFHYEQAARLNPNHVNCQNNFGAALLRTNRLEEALSHCTLAAALDPASPLVKINLGNIHFLMQEYEAARTCFSEAIALNDRLAPAYYGLGSVEQALKSDPSRIRELYLKAVEINPSIPEVQQALGNLLAADANPDALSHFSAAAQLNPNLKNLHRDLGAAYFQMGRREEALKHMRIALEQNPEDAIVQEILVREAENPA